MPEVVLGQYKGLVEQEEVEVTDEQVDKFLESSGAVRPAGYLPKGGTARKVIW